MKSRPSHYQMLKNFYIKSSKGTTKAKNNEDAFVKGNGVSSILITYHVILVRGQDTLVRIWTNLKKYPIKITFFSINIIH